MNDSERPDERCVSWKILLPFGPGSRVCAVGLDEGGIAGLNRSYETVDTKPIESLRYDVLIIGDEGYDDQCNLHSLISRIKPDGIVVNVGRKCLVKQLNDAGFRYSRHYAALPADKPRLFIPLASRKLRAKGLAFHSPGSFTARAGLTAAKGLSLLGLKRHLEKRTVGIHAKDGGILTRQELTEWLAEKLGYSVIDLVVYAGSESPRRKITALAIATEPEKDVVVKIADTESGTEAIKQESEALKAIEDSSISNQAPKLIWEGQWDNYYVQLQEKAIGVGCKQTASLKNAHIKFLSKLSTIGRKVMPLKETRTWRDLKALAGTTSSEAIPQPARIALEKVLSDEFASVLVICHRTHGDFTPWNIKTRDSKLVVYDWEDSLSDGLALTDIFHFLYRQASLVGPRPGVQRFLKQIMNITKRLSCSAYYETGCISKILTIWLLSEYFATPFDFLSDILDSVLEYNQ